MPDIGIVWDPANVRGDWARLDQAPIGADDGTGGDLTAAVLVSLFTDRRASPDFVLKDGTQNRRGWWADVYEDEPIGSLLWTLLPAKKTNAVLLAARDYCNHALAWMVRDGHASAVEVNTFWSGQVTLGIDVTILQTKGPGAVIRTSLPITYTGPVAPAPQLPASGGSVEPVSLITDDVGFFTSFMGYGGLSSSGGAA